MPLQNRLTPMGDIIADAARGRLTGNRGILHDAARRLGTPRWRTVSSCEGRRRHVTAPGRYAELISLDESDRARRRQPPVLRVPGWRLPGGVARRRERCVARRGAIDRKGP